MYLFSIAYSFLAFNVPPQSCTARISNDTMAEDNAPDIEAGDNSTPFIRHTNIRALCSKVLASLPGNRMLASVGLSRSTESEHSCAGEPVELFQKHDGQALLLAFNFAGSDGATAINIHVYRPSHRWATRMAYLESDSKPLPVTLPRSSNRATPRWREIQKDSPKESEVDIWYRIKRSYREQWPWYAILPFWRPKVLEERMVSILYGTVEHPETE